MAIPVSPLSCPRTGPVPGKASALVREREILVPARTPCTPSLVRVHRRVSSIFALPGPAKILLTQQPSRMAAVRQPSHSARSSLSDVAALEAEEGWKGAVVYRRSGSRTLFSVTTTLERLALPHLSSSASREEALRVVGESASFSESLDEQETSDISGSSELAPLEASGVHDWAPSEAGTPVAVSFDVRREGKDLRLEGEARTVLALQCNRCLQPTIEPIEASFSLLLSSSPVHEPTQRSLGVVLGRDQQVDHSWGDVAEDYADDSPGDALDLDLDDKVFFPPEQAEVDISKHVRDAVHLEVPLKVLCSAACKGMCLDCGVNLNVAKCKCQGPQSLPSNKKEPPGTGGSGRRGSLSMKEQLEKLYKK